MENNELLEQILKDNPNLKIVKDYNGRYLISNTGDVYSLVTNKLKKLSAGISKTGYYVVCLYINGKKNMKNVHRLVAEAFIENKYPYINKVINHKDGIKTNNHVENLEWCTHRQNLIHSIKTGLRPRGEQMKNAKLNDEKVLYIYQKQGKISRRILAEQFGVSPHLIMLIQKNKIWKHVKKRKEKYEKKLLKRPKRKI